MEKNEKIIRKSVAGLLILLLAGMILTQFMRIKDPVFLEWDYVCLPDGMGRFVLEISYITDITDHRSINLAELVDEKERDKYIIAAYEDGSVNSNGYVTLSNGRQIGLYMLRSVRVFIQPQYEFHKKVELGPIKFNYRGRKDYELMYTGSITLLSKVEELEGNTSDCPEIHFQFPCEVKAYADEHRGNAHMRRREEP